MIDILHADAAVVDACRKAKQACTTWAQTAPQQRADTLSRAANLVEANASELAELNTRETHKLLADSQNGVSAGIATLRQFAELGPLHQGQRLRGEVRSVDFSIPQPHGVVAVLTPWNDPVAIACGLLGAALVSGNTVVYKPSERCPAVGKQLGDLLTEVFPPGVFTTVTGPGSTGAEIIVQGEIDMVAHVGSTASGARIARAGALTGAHTILENGGNDPLIIDDDVDVGWAAEQAALGCFANAGQICTSVERIFVHQRIAKEFTHALCGEASRRETEGKFGPLVDQMQRNEVHHQVVESLNRGARLVLGGKIPSGDQPVESFYPATVVTNVESGMPWQSCRMTMKLKS